MRHLIRQQYLHVAVNGTEAEAMALQARLSDLCQHLLLPALEQVLDRFAPAKGHLVFEHLELDVGYLPSDRLDQDLAAAVAQALEKALQEPVTKNTNGQQQLNPVAKVPYRTDRQAVSEAFSYFLQTGRLPWFFRLPPGRNLEQALLEAWQESPPEELFPAPGSWRQVLATPASRHRLIHQFTASLQLTFLRQVSPAGHQVMCRLLEKLPHPGVPADSLAAGQFKAFEKRLWEKLLARLAANRSLTEADLVREAGQDLALPPGKQTYLLAFLEQAWPGTAKAIPLSSVAPDSQNNKNLAPASGPAPLDQEAKEGLYLDNAGLVLLHPFLPRFLEHLGVAEADKLLNPNRALCLLHFLATGQPLAPEYELLLPKLLCGIPLEQPVEEAPPLTEGEQAEAEALLAAVIRHWEALKSTSPDGLRGTFLVRPGRLSLRNDGDWLLQVESKAYDILLNRLPWTISMIRLPWMESLLRVEWSY